MNKWYVTFLVLALITPQFALAAWWNPFTWSFFNTLFGRETPQETLHWSPAPTTTLGKKGISPEPQSRPTSVQANPPTTKSNLSETSSKASPPKTITTPAEKPAEPKNQSAPTSATDSSTEASIASTSCDTIQQTLTVGSTGKEVSTLQGFLYKQLKLDILEAQSGPASLTAAKVITGTFTTATRSLLYQVQKENNLPLTSVTDEATRAFANKILCNDNTPAPATTPSQSTTVIADPSDPCAPKNISGSQHPYQPCAPVISSVSPGGGPIETVVTLKGSGFTPDSQVMLGGGVHSAVSSDGTTITFTIPKGVWKDGRSVTTGIYNFAVKNKYGTSNTKSLTVAVSFWMGIGSPIFTGSPSDGPATTKLGFGQTGTWRVYTGSIGIQSGEFTFTVNWGDGTPTETVTVFGEGVGGANAGGKATFTHAYAQAGSYTATFTAHDTNKSYTDSESLTILVGNAFIF